MSSLTIKNLNKIYPNKVQAVFDFNLEIADKEFVVLVGPSGCGKSTTLRMIAGLESISSGELYIDDDFMNNVEPKDRNIAMVFQSYALYPTKTVYGNIAFALKLRKVPTPVYEKEEVDKNLLVKRKTILKEISKFKHSTKKGLISSEKLTKRNELYNDLYTIEDQIKNQKVQKIEIDEYKIYVLEQRIKELLKKFDVAPENENIQLEKTITELKSQIEYLQNNKTPIYKNKKPSRLDMDIAINKVAEQIDLVPYLYRKPAALSGGQRQRVALARAMVRKPKVFLMDEPLSNLDAKLRVQTRNEIRKLHDDVGATTIYVTHDQTEAMTMADKIVVMKDGYIQQIGTPKDIYENPANKFVGSFIGSFPMNFIDALYSNGYLEIDFNGEKAKICVKNTMAQNLKDYENKEVIIGIRPANISLISEPSEDKTNSNMNCKWNNLELIGEEILIHTNINNISLLAKANKQDYLKENKNIKIAFDMDNLYLFDKQTEKRIG